MVLGEAVLLAAASKSYIAICAGDSFDQTVYLDSVPVKVSAGQIFTKKKAPRYWKLVKKRCHIISTVTESVTILFSFYRNQQSVALVNF